MIQRTPPSGVRSSPRLSAKRAASQLGMVRSMGALPEKGTPISSRMPPAVPEDSVLVIEQENEPGKMVIPGGPKLARTPPRGTPLAAPHSDKKPPLGTHPQSLCTGLGYRLG